MLLPSFPLTLPNTALFSIGPRFNVLTHDIQAFIHELAPNKGSNNVCGLASTPDGTIFDLTNDANACTPFPSPIDFFVLDDPAFSGKCGQCAVFENADCSGKELKIQIGPDAFGNTVLFKSRRCGDVDAGEAAS